MIFVLDEQYSGTAHNEKQQIAAHEIQRNSPNMKARYKAILVEDFWNTLAMPDLSI